MAMTAMPANRSLIWRVAARPFISGIERSSTTTSGLSAATLSRATRPFGASAMTSISLRDASRARRPCRTVSWSSARITLILAISGFVHYCRARDRRLEVDRRAAARLRLDLQRAANQRGALVHAHDADALGGADIPLTRFEA